MCMWSGIIKPANVQPHCLRRNVFRRRIQGLNAFSASARNSHRSNPGDQYVDIQLGLGNRVGGRSCFIDRLIFRPGFNQRFPVLITIIVKLVGHIRHKTARRDRTHKRIMSERFGECGFQTADILNYGPLIRMRDGRFAYHGLQQVGSATGSALRSISGKSWISFQGLAAQNTLTICITKSS